MAMGGQFHASLWTLVTIFTRVFLPMTLYTIDMGGNPDIYSAVGVWQTNIFSKTNQERSIVIFHLLKQIQNL